MARSRDTMNRPDSKVLNTSAEPTVAAKAFEKAVKENSVTPAIATGFVPPVLAEEKKEVEVKRSPFRQVKTEGDTESAPAPKKEGPAIATGFIPMPGYMKKQEINPFKSNKGPVKRPASASINHAAAADVEEAAEEETEEMERPSERPSFTAALAGQEVHSTFRPTEFKSQERIDPFKHNSEKETKVETEPEPEVVSERKTAPKNRRSPFQTMRTIPEAEPVDPVPAPVKAEEPAKEEVPKEPEVETATAVVEEPETETAPVQESVAEPDPEPVEEKAVVDEEPPVETVPAAEKEPEPELVFPSYSDEDIDLEPLGDTSPFKPLDHEVVPDADPEPKPQRSEPTFYTSGTEEKSHGGLLSGLFKRR